jgi:hypothetical protein
MTTRQEAVLALATSNSVQDSYIADALNAQTETVDGDSPILTISNALVVANVWGKLQDDVHNHADKTRREFLHNVLYLFEAKGASTLGWGDSPQYPLTIEASLDGLITYGYIDANFKAFVMNQRYVTRQKWDPPFTHIEVAAIRGRG